MTSAKEARASRKHSRTSTTTVEGTTTGKKARGRPRVDTQDATATERRRTQIRLAQRAYRQRKETKIVVLKERNSHLRSIIEQMNTTFRQLNQSVLNSGLLQLNSELAQEFEHATDNFDDLLKTANEDQDDGDEEKEDVAERLYEQNEERSQHTIIEAESEQLCWGYSVPVITSKVKADSYHPPHHSNEVFHPSGAHGKSVPTSSLVLHRQSAIGDILDERNVSIPQQALQTASHSQQLPFGLVDLMSPHNALDTTPNLEPHIQSVSTFTPQAASPTTRLSTPLKSCPAIPTGIPLELRAYSFKETTFARRLNRCTLEAGYELLGAVDTRHAALNHVFRLSLPFLSPEQIRTRFRNVLSRGIDDDLDWWETPFIQLGGAGTHYPPRDATGRVLPFKNAWRVRKTGLPTRKFTQLENAFDGRLETLNGVDLSGLEGHWFDAHDVQCYLEEVYACQVTPGSSHAECLIEDDISSTFTDQGSLSSYFDATTRRESLKSTHSGPVPSSTNSSASATPESSFLIMNEPPVQLGGLSDSVRFGLDMNFAQKPTPNHGSQFQGVMDSELSLNNALGIGITHEHVLETSVVSRLNAEAKEKMMGEEGMSLPSQRQKREKIVTIDVNRFIKEMIKGCICLGRAPGFRQKDIDVALHAAILA